MKNPEHAFFPVNHVLHFLPQQTLPRNLKYQKKISLFLYFHSNETHKISQIYKHKDMPTDLQNTKTFNNYSVILSHFHYKHKDLQGFKIPSTNPKSLHALIEIYRPKQTQKAKTQSNHLDRR